MTSLPVISIFLISISVLVFAETDQTGCCFKYVTRQIPRRFVVDYAYTSDFCWNPGVVFITRRDYKICANPQDQWRNLTPQMSAASAIFLDRFAMWLLVMRPAPFVPCQESSVTAYKVKGPSQSYRAVQNKHPESPECAPESALLPPPRTMVSLAVLSILIISIPGFSFETEKFGPVLYQAAPNDLFAVKHIPNACCHSYTRQIRYSLVMDFYETSSQCLKPGIIFLTNRGRQICADPRKEWVQVYMFSLKQKKKTEEYRSQRKHFYTSVELSLPEK
ncbi:uncharacterized protein LOC122755267 [Dromiciops gliroides]|uniref:uncharacterized protein LOC122755267 n=1 Tax=Dromiciops gliroides TaxID=33562 RepID=UPI001CC78A74|nr:uncharacterized protein LOC122755267 [Dromiciops gliroides]